MGGRAGRHYTSMLIIAATCFVASMIFKAYHVKEWDRIAMTVEQLKVLRKYQTPSNHHADQAQKGAISIPKQRSDKLLKHVQGTCDTFNISLPLTYFMLSHMHVDHKRRVVYCFIPKVASTSWKRIWMKMTGIVDHDVELSQIDRLVIHTAVPTLDWQTTILPYVLATYRKFMFVRHPFARVLSAFKDKLEHQDIQSKYDFHKEVGVKIQQKYRTAGGNYTGTNTTFQEFIRFISEPGLGTFEQRNEHWVSVHEICNPCGVKYDFIGKYESLKEDADYVLDWLDVSDLVKEFPTSDRPFHAKQYQPQYFSQLTHNERAEFFQKYLTDFVAFNYTFL